jgi:hypothetical protein
MRHSSWTLFLVPLALPLVLLLPGALKNEDPAGPVARAGYEQFREEVSSGQQQFRAVTATPEEPPEELSEALYKD